MSSANSIAEPYPATSRTTGWRGVALVAITYIYFLIFAQFAFLQRLAQLRIADAHLKAVMAAMAFGGILFSLLTPRTKILAAPRKRLQLALTLSATAALLTLLRLNLPSAIAVAFLIGAALGTLTVTLVTHLPVWIGSANPLPTVDVAPGVVDLPPAHRALEARLGGHVRLGADDRVDAGLAAGGVEVEDPVHVAVVGDPEGGLAVLDRRLDQVLDPGGTVEHRELGVGVQVGERP